MLTFDGYQDDAARTAVYPTEIGLMYCTLGLCGEAGEVADKVKKLYRDGDGTLTVDQMMMLRAEMGDVLWYLAMLCGEIGVTLESVAEANLRKLQDRAKRDALHGSGDDR